LTRSVYGAKMSFCKLKLHVSNGPLTHPFYFNCFVNFFLNDFFIKNSCCYTSRGQETKFDLVYPK
jgi:hypothetical protein